MRSQKSRPEPAVTNPGYMGDITYPDNAGGGYKYYLLAAMYLAQTMPMGFIMGGLPVIMRANGMSLKSIGFLYMLHLPWAFKFVHASYVDTHQVGKLGRRRSWILPMQWLTASFFGILSWYPPERNPPVMFVLCLLSALAMATNDIAVDGYATDMLSPEERPWGNTIQSGARSLGMIFGCGVPLLFYENVGWRITCLAFTAALMLLNLPVLLHNEIVPREYPERDITRDTAKPAGMFALIKRPGTWWLVVYLVAPTVFYFLGFQMRLPLLNDLGLPPRSLGMAMIWCGCPAGILGSLLGGFLYRRLGPLPLMRWYVLAALGLSVLTVLLVWLGGVAPWCGLLLIGLDNMLLGTVHVWCFTLMMKASAGPESGTGFALFSSIFLFPPLLLAPLFGMVADAHGFSTLYLLLAGLLVLGFVGARAIARNRLEAFFDNGRAARARLRTEIV